MKKFFILLMMAFSSGFVFSQDLNDINEFLGKKDYASAKAGIDKFLTDSKNNTKADGWYFKGRVYNAYSYDKSVPENSLYDLKNSAFEAFKKYQELDTKDLRMKMENYGSYLDLYYGFYDLGANLFNSKDFANSYKSFKKALEVESFILDKKYTYTQTSFNAMDTALILNIAIAATQAKMDDDAVIYYKKIVDAGISGETYLVVYEFLVEYYNKKNDAVNLADMLAKSKKLYPQNNYWNEIEINNIVKTGDKQALYAKYDDMISKEPGNYALAYNYAVELYGAIYGKDAKFADDINMKEKFSNVLKTAIASDKGIDATVLMTNHLYNMAADLSAAAAVIKSTKPDDVKKKNELKALSSKKMDECINYSEQAVKYFEPKTDLNGMQNANYKIVLGYLSDIYNLKGDAKKAAEYDKKRDLIK